MKKITLLLLFLLSSTLLCSAQTLNQPASWPNIGWTVSGSYTAGGVIGDPSVNASFGFDDDAAGNGSVDNIVATSPVIDLTAANGAGENLISISGDFVYRALGGDVLQIEVYNADATTWTTLETFAGNSATTDYQTCVGTDPYTTAELDISGFTATQLSGFQYRISYDDAGGFQWGFCLSSPTISSAAPIPPFSCSGTSSFVFTENFESDPPASWTGTGFSGANGNWDITNANANSGSTGPTNAYDNGSGMHLEYEASGNSTATASAISPAIDLTSSVDGAELSFFMHAYGAAMGTLNVGVSNSPTGPFTTVFTQVGQLQTAAGDAWVPFNVNLSAYVGQTIYIEFENTGSGTSYTGDMSIDFIRVEACDAPTCTPPTTQATADATTNINSVTGSATINWTAGADGDNILVVMREGTAVDVDPTIGISYTANSAFGTPAAEFGTGNYVVYDGAKTNETVNITNLNQGTTYHFALYQYSTPDFCYNITGNTGNFVMPCATPGDVSALNAAPNNEQINLNWTDSTCFDDVLVVAKSGSAVTAIPSGDGSTYVANSYFGIGTEITTDEFVVYQGIANTETITNLINGTTYHFTVFTRIGTTWSTGVSINAIPNFNYCDVIGDLTYLTSITLVDFGSINNVTGQDGQGAADGYSDFTNLSTTVTKGTSQDLTINVNTDGNFRVFSFVWIDWNQDGDFDDSGEAYDLGFAANTPDGPTSLSALPISIPTSAAIGNTRMRIVCQYNDPDPAPIEILAPCLDSTDGEFEDYTINVIGSVTYTYANGWSEDPNGVATLNDDIIIASGDTTINSNTTCNSVTVHAGAGLTINTGFVLDTNNGLALESSSTSYSSLILDGTVFGTLTYERHVNINGSGTTGSNDLISAPLTGQAFNDFATANPNILNNGTQYLFGPFDKTTGAYLIYTSSETTTLDAGIGYRAGSSDNGTFTFTGTANNSTVSVDIINAGPIEPAEQEWNLVGNPYPSYLNVQAFLNHDVDDTASVVTNLQLFNAGTAAIYGYDGTALDDWTIYNLANTTSSTVIAPGQGFFVSADATNAPLYDLEFTPAMRRTGASDDFIVGRNAELIYVKLNASTSSNSYATEIYFNNNSSLGFDLGYDAALFGTTPDFAIYSNLVQDNNGEPMNLQSLNSSNLTEVTIPLGVNANQGEKLTFSIVNMTLPTSVYVYLDDTVANTTTLLNNSDYVFTPTTDLSGTGRFFLRTSEDALSTIDNSYDTLNIFALNNEKELVVKGQLKDNTVLSLYDIQGREVLTAQLDNSSLDNRIDTSELSAGVYIVNVQNLSLIHI